MNRLKAGLAAVTAAALLAACGAASEPPAFKGTDITGAGWGKGLQLADHAGRPRTIDGMVDHSTGIYAIDTSRRVRLFFGTNDRSVDAMIRDVKLLLAA